MKKLAVIFPGMGYGKDKPLLYYAARQAKELGYEIIYTDYDGVPEMTGNSREAKTIWTEAAYLLVKEQLADVDWEDKEIVFIAKSVGTIIASKYAADHDLDPLMILLTPLDETFEFLTGEKNYLFSGKADPLIHPESHDLSDSRIAEMFLCGESNHSLEGRNVDEDLDTLREIVRQIRRVLTGEEWDGEQ